MQRMLVAVMRLVLVGLVFLAGCSEGRSPGETDASPTESTSAQSPFDPDGGQHALSSGRSLSVKVSPRQPRAGQHLLARVGSGTTPTHFAWIVNGQPVAGQSGAGLDAGFFAKGDEVTVRAFSGKGSVETSVVIGNTPPEVLSVTLSNHAVFHGVDIELEPVGDDFDGDPVQFRTRWFVNDTQKLFFNDQLKLPGDQFERGDRIGLTVIPFDGETEGAPFVAEEVLIPNALPEFAPVPEGRIEGNMYTNQVLAEDADGDVVSFRLTDGPEGMLIDGETGTISWAFDDVPDEPRMVHIVAEDGYGGEASLEFSLSFARQ